MRYVVSIALLLVGIGLIATGVCGIVNVFNVGNDKVPITLIVFGGISFMWGCLVGWDVKSECGGGG